MFRRDWWVWFTTGNLACVQSAVSFTGGAAAFGFCYYDGTSSKCISVRSIFFFDLIFSALLLFKLTFPNLALQYSSYSLEGAAAFAYFCMFNSTKRSSAIFYVDDQWLQATAARYITGRVHWQCRIAHSRRRSSVRWVSRTTCVRHTHSRFLHNRCKHSQLLVDLW